MPGERDYRVTYRSREADDDDRRDSRRHFPTALDPYLYPEDRAELKENIAMMKARNRGYDDDFRHDRSAARAMEIDDDYSTTAVKYRSRPTTRATDYEDGLDTPVRENTRQNVRPGTTKTTYSVTEAGLERETESSRRPKSTPQRRDTVYPGESISRQSSFEESKKTDVRVERSRVQSMPREPVAASERSRGVSRQTGFVADRYDDRERDYSVMDYEIERPYKQGGVYVVDIGESRGFGGYRNDPYEDAKSGYTHGTSRPLTREDKRTIYAERDDARSSMHSLQAPGPYVSGARATKSQTEFRGPSRGSARRQDDFRETKREATIVSGHRGGSRTANRREEDEKIMQIDDRRLERPAPITEDFRDPFGPDPSLVSSRGRARANTFEDDYVMVSPPRKSVAPSEGTLKTSDTLRSAMVREDTYTPRERLRRRRSRSISFREAEVDKHCAGDRFHQRPGEEAALAGKYLNSYDADTRRDRYRDQNRDQERMNYEYSSKTSRNAGAYERDERDSRYVREDRYAPQHVGSRHRRRKDDDDESYISRNFEKTVKTTYY